MNKNNSAFLFYAGTLFSSVGNLTFTTCLVAFMLKSEFSLASISLILGLQRLLPILVIGIWGHLTDRLNPKLTVVVLEIIAAGTSIALLLLWKGHETVYSLLAFVCLLRAFMISFQLGSRSKISKLLGSDEYASNSKNAIWLMKATQGATLFGGIIAFVIIKNFNLETAILFDFITFVVNGVLIYGLSIESNDDKALLESDESWFKKFSDLFKHNKEAALLDIFLALSLFGWASYTARLAGVDQSWNGLFTASYGLAVWVAGFAERSFAKRVSSAPFWVIQAIAYVGLAMFGGPHYLTLVMVLIRDVSYWVILHRISSHIQRDSPSKLMGGISSARFTIMVIILAGGEMVVGGWSNFVPLWIDSGLRALITIGVGAVLLTKKSQKAVIDGRPIL